MAAIQLQQCPVCGHKPLVRRKRTFWEKFRHAAVYRCPSCRFEAAAPITVAYPQFSTIARCPHCGGTDLRVLPKRDPIEKMYRGPLSTLWRWMGAPLLYCRFCRLQFYDFRQRMDSGGDTIA
jgi:DNA-directed RNA polymerase subunit RPC12/RpoP